MLLTWLASYRRTDGAALGLAVLGGLVTLGWSVWAVVEASGSLDSGVDHVWLAALDIRWHLGLDGISSPLVLMTTLVVACCLVSLVRQPPEGGGRAQLAALLLLIEAGVLGSFLALDMVLFFAFFEVSLIPMWFVIHHWGDHHDPVGRRRAATRFLVFTVLGSALMLVGFVLVRSEAGTFDIVRIAASYSPSGTAAVAGAVLVALGLAIKTPLWPLHIWLPDAHSKAPTVGSVVLAAVLLKLGTYGFIRFWMPVADPAWKTLVPFVAGLAVIGIVYAALACLAQTDLKRLIAYSSVGHMGFVVLALATFTVGGVQGGGLRECRARADHRPAVLRGRGDQGPLRHRRPGAARPALRRRAPRRPASSRSPPSPRSGCPGSPASGARCSRSGRRCTPRTRCPARRTSSSPSSPPSA